ncbi:MAG: GNAT family N-acetyltransferase [Flavobacteriaceae bacterium]|nr:GNAT family N-acetyltransferase [Bacteroidia bacterium]NNF76182.1 GNAT family N-acetyltransferase [Flavobacteriaceae bacterium]
MIRIAKHQDINAILAITQACAKEMIKAKIYQWNEHYPDRASFEQDIEQNELFVYEIKGSVIGCIAISSLMDVEYKDVEWLSESGNNIYIHRLAIKPDFQGKGYAQQLMRFAENKSRIEKRRSIRLDTFSKNIRNQRFYEQRGYERLGDVYFHAQSEYPFYCYEYLL